MRYVGKPVKRVIEDLPIITGRSTYVNDITLNGTLHAYFVRSPYAHAKFQIRGCPKGCYPVRDLYNPGWLKDEVTFAGEPVAVVLAEDEYKAVDLAEQVEVEYSPLDPVVDPWRATEPNSPKARSDLKSNVFKESEVNTGDVESALKGAYRVVEGELINQRVIPSAMEPRGAVAKFDGKRLTIWSSTQSAFFVRNVVREAVSKYGVREVRAIQPEVGGAFGSKIIVYPEEVMVAILSVITGRPVKWFNTRSEDMLTTNHGRDMRLRFKAGFDKQGKLLGIQGTLLFDAGAPFPEVNNDSFGMASTAAAMITGHYSLENIKIKVLGVNTNKTIIGAYRGAGRPEGSYFIERIMNLGARALGADQFQIREVNALKEANYLKTPTGITHDSGKYAEALRRAKPAYLELLRKRDEIRAKGRKAGVGVSFPAEIASFGPYETAKVKVTPDGEIQVISGSGPHGQGDGTAFAQIAADVFEVDIERVKVIWGDTDLIADGQLTAGSRTVTVGGSAVYEASMRLKNKLMGVAAEKMGVKAEELTYSEGKIVHEKTGKSMTLQEVAAESLNAGLLPEENYSYVMRLYTSPYGVHLALVEVDGETGFVKVLDYRAFDDVGNVINPLLAEGQVHGGVLQGIGQALYEEAVYSEDGHLLTGTFSDYALPTAVEAPVVSWISLTLSKSDTPLGSKGIGELGTIASTPAAINAVEDAINAQVTSMPAKPDYLVKLMSK